MGNYCDTDPIKAIAFVMVKAMGNLRWISSGEESPFRQRLVQETQRLTLNYLQSYSF